MTGLPDDPRIEQAVEAATEVLLAEAIVTDPEAADLSRQSLTAAWPLLRQVARDEAADELARQPRGHPWSNWEPLPTSAHCEGWHDALDHAEQIVRRGVES